MLVATKNKTVKITSKCKPLTEPGKYGDTIRNYRTYFSNGETQITGFLNDTDIKITLPSVCTDAK